VYEGHCLPDVRRLCTHLTGAIVYLSQPHSRLLLFLISTDPDAEVDIELVIGQEHPA